MKRILGLDLGTNSIGWAVINAQEDENKNLLLESIEAAGSRIIPMDAATLSDFNNGNTKSQTAERRGFRSIRRLHERFLLRRERIHRVLRLMGFLPKHYAESLTRYGKFRSEKECKLPWKKNEEGTYEFIFRSSFDEMVEDFRKHQPELLKDGKKIPYDWTIYYLRTKALKYPVTKEELSWIILNFNQKRGYYQLRGEEQEENAGKLEEYYKLKVDRVEDSGENRGKDKRYNVYLENGMVYSFVGKNMPDWVGKEKEFIVTTNIDDKGNPQYDKYGKIKRSFRLPKEDDWNLLKKKTEKDIEESQETVGAYIYHALLFNPSQKIKGKLVRTVERKFYKDELRQILKIQSEFHPELKDKGLYEDCVKELYAANESYRNGIAHRGFVYLLCDDIIFYQRPLKSKKSLISNCPYESHSFVDKQTGEIKVAPIKCIPRSHPLFQEFRLWQFLQNLHIYQKERVVNGQLQIDVDVTSEFLSEEENYADLFDWMNNQCRIKQEKLLAKLGIDKKNFGKYRWNYVEDKDYPANETRGTILGYLKKAGIGEDFLSRIKEEELWHLLYSINDKKELEQALKTFAERNVLTDEFVSVFKSFPTFEKSYGAYSAKAIKKLLSVMRMGKYWSVTDIDENTYTRIQVENHADCQNGCCDKYAHLTDVSQLHGLPLWLACYVVYGRHSEVSDVTSWESPQDLDNYLANFVQGSLRNPIVEQVITETLRTVRDIWKQVGRIDEIHLEMGREMKNPKEQRIRMTRKSLENENANLRVKALLTEFMNADFKIENVRPYSSSQQDLFRIYEDTVLSEYKNEISEDISAILKKFNERDSAKRPSHSEVLRYKLWLDQKYRSPYTGEMIPLAKLFTSSYEIEHVIPQSRYFDDSFSNKVICEAEVNRLKGNLLGYEFIKKHHGEIVTLNYGKQIKIFTVGEYEEFVKEHYSSRDSSLKMKKLLMEDVPEQFIARQLNDTRYISRFVKGVLSNIVREPDEQEATSKHVILCTGGVTDRLKKDWGIGDVWNKIVLPRFERMNELQKTTEFTVLTVNNHLIPNMPLEYQKGFNKKRIDHRHHAMDAIVIACATRNMVNYLNNESACKDAKVTRQDLQKLLCEKVHADDKGNYNWVIKKPWNTFTQDVFVVLQNMIVSFKQNIRVINRTKNRYQHYENGKKVMALQTKGDSWAIRKPMHKATVLGELNLRTIEKVRLSEALKNIQRIVNKDLKKKLWELVSLEYDIKKIKKYFEDNKEAWNDVDLSKIEIYCFSKESNKHFFASRTLLDTSFKKEMIEKSIADTAIRKILLRHLENKGGNADVAFSPDGIDEMNRNIKELNGGRSHQPIYKVRKFEESNMKFAIGSKGCKASMFVEAEKGTNLFFAVYETESEDKQGNIVRKRKYASVPLNVVIDRQKKGLASAPEDKEGNVPKFVLSPNDLVYVPTADELREGKIRKPLKSERIYKMVSCTGNQLYFVQVNVAKSIIDKVEYTSLNKMERAVTNEMIKEICIPLQVDRLGNIINEVKL